MLAIAASKSISALEIPRSSPLSSSWDDIFGIET
jgi:hypothetical protein